MRIPLPKMMRAYRAQEFERGLTPGAARWGLGVWRAVASRPWVYRRVAGLANFGLKLLAWGGPRMRWMPLGGGWTRHRDFPAPPIGGTFQAQWKGPR